MIIKNTFRKSGFSFNLLKIPNRSSLTLNPLNNALKINKTKYAVKCCALLSNRFVITGNFKNKKLKITSHIPINPICVIISLLIIPSSRLLGVSFIYFESAGSFPSIIALLIQVLSDHTPKEILDADLYFIDRIGLKDHLSPTRSNGLLAMVKQIKMYALAYESKH